MNTYSDEALHSSITTLINELYQEAEVEVPGLRRRITPLGELVGSLNLANKELPGLSQQVAMRYLMQQGVLIENLEAAGLDELAGFLYVNISYGCIFVDANDHLTRRRFSVAHELGHSLLHFRPLLKIAERDREYLELTEVLYRGRNDDPQETASGRVERLQWSSRDTLAKRVPYYLLGRPRCAGLSDPFTVASYFSTCRLADDE